jgi:hypothetical protein
MCEAEAEFRWTALACTFPSKCAGQGEKTTARVLRLIRELLEGQRHELNPAPRAHSSSL